MCKHICNVFSVHYLMHSSVTVKELLSMHIMS